MLRAPLGRKRELPDSVLKRIMEGREMRAKTITRAMVAVLLAHGTAHADWIDDAVRNAVSTRLTQLGIKLAQSQVDIREHRYVRGLEGGMFPDGPADGYATWTVKVDGKRLDGRLNLRFTGNAPYVRALKLTLTRVNGAARRRLRDHQLLEQRLERAKPNAVELVTKRVARTLGIKRHEVRLVRTVQRPWDRALQVSVRTTADGWKTTHTANVAVRARRPLLRITNMQEDSRTPTLGRRARTMMHIERRRR